MMNEIRELLLNARQRVAVQVNTELLSTYWNVGRIIVEHEQENKERADYGKQTLKQLSKELTAEFGKGFSRSNLQNMRAFYLAYPICQTVSGKLELVALLRTSVYFRHGQAQLLRKGSGQFRVVDTGTETPNLYFPL